MIFCPVRSERPDCCRAQSVDLPFEHVACEAAGEAAGDQPRQRLLSAAVSFGRRPRLKYEEVYLPASASAPEARAGIGRYFNFYNSGRPHSSFGCRTPVEVYFHQPLLEAA